MESRKELIELIDYLEKKLIELSLELEFRSSAKASAKKNVFGMVNIIIELRHTLLHDAEVSDPAVIDAVEVINKLYFKVYDSRDKVRRAIFNKPKTN